jgi:hypothetical protein
MGDALCRMKIRLDLTVHGKMKFTNAMWPTKAGCESRCCVADGNFSAHRSGALTLYESATRTFLLQVPSKKIILFRVKWIFDTCLSQAMTFFQPSAQTQLA